MFRTRRASAVPAARNSPHHPASPNFPAMRRALLGWTLLLGITALFWVAAALRYTAQKNLGTPARAAAEIEHDLRRRMRALEGFRTETPTIRALFTGTENAETFARVQRLPFSFFLTDSTGTLRFWNRAPQALPTDRTADPKGSLLQTPLGPVIRLAWRDGAGLPDGAMLTALLPLKRTYPVTNAYLGASFAASPSIPADLLVLRGAARGAAPVRSPAGRAWAWIAAPQEALRAPSPDRWTCALLLAAVLATAALLHRVALALLRITSRRWALLVAFSIVGGARAITYALPLPLGLAETELFSSRIYGFSALLPSLGDLLVNALCLLWIVGFGLAHGASPAALGRRWNMSLPTCWTAAALLSVVMQAAVFYAARVVASLVLDSQISFDVGRFHTINIYTVVGFGALGALAAAVALLLYFFGRQLAVLLPVRGQRYGLLAAVGLLVGFWGFGGLISAAALAAIAVWTTAFCFLLDARKPAALAVLVAPRAVICAVALSASLAVLLHSLIRTRTYTKDLVAFAERVVGQEDPLLEYSTQAALAGIAQDLEVQSFMRAPDSARRAVLNARLDALYFSQGFGAFRPAPHFFAADSMSLFNPDALSQASFEEAIAAAIPTPSPGLFYNATAPDGVHYIARLPLPNGTLYLPLTLRRTVAETVYPELLQPEEVRGPAREESYPYAVYAGGLPVTQTEGYAFPEAVQPAPLHATAQRIKREDRTELWIPQGDGRTVIVVGPERKLLDSAALFSYLFAVFTLLGGVVLLYRAFWRWMSRSGHRAMWPVRRFSLRQGIHLSLLGIVLLCLLGAGLVTVRLFDRRFRQSTDARLKATVQTIARSLAAQLPTASFSGEDSAARSPVLRYTLASIAEVQKADLSLFDTRGRLIASSQEEIYNRGLLPPQLRPEAWRAIRTGAPVLLQRERVGAFSYQSAYTPLRADDGTTLGILQVPFFSSEKELNDQISGLLVSLLNLYALFLILATGLAYLITQGLTRTLTTIAQRLGQLSLQRNEPIDWPYDDEIGLLVREYNNMLRTVEQSAAQLARSEREGAWREMARQVAHEIKNPLTPMKLHIQYLQRALHEERADVPQLTGRVAGILIEQIDTLSRIASEFSDFARMPEARPEPIELGPLLARAAELHGAGDGVQVSLDVPAAPVNVIADRGHLLRAVTNLLQNAVQAIPDGRAGRIAISVEEAPANRVLIHISDNGSGIAEGERDRIFKPYFTTKSSGTGLGLAMTRQMVEGWGGRIWFESNEGEGTTFSVEVPRLGAGALPAV